MTQPALTREQMQETVNAVARCGNVVRAAAELGRPTQTIQHRFRSAVAAGIRPTVKSKVELDNRLMAARIRQLEAEVRNLEKQALSAELVKREIFKLAKSDAPSPEWLRKGSSRTSAPGVPTLFASDWHWGEVVDPKQIGGVNQYSVAIAKRRAHALVDQAIALLRIISPKMDYPGIVFALGGDMVSGDIHEELQATNETEIMPCVVDVAGVLTWCIETLADAIGRVFIPAVTGNHGRDTKKIRAKGRNYTNFDWLLYQWLAARFQHDKRITFQIPDGPDARYRVYSTRYLLTHGDQFSGGDGIIGPVGPIMRGDNKKRSSRAQMDQSYDVLMVGHFHQLMQLPRLIVNGALKGMDEYAYGLNVPFEEPSQALWITHPVHGITIQTPVYVEREHRKEAHPWVSVAA